MNKVNVWVYGQVLAAGVFLCLSGCGKGSTPAPNSRRAFIRLTATDLTGLDAKYFRYRQQVNGTMQLEGTGLASNNQEVVLEDYRQPVGEINRVVIGFDAVKAGNSVRPGPSARYVAEILVDGVVRSRAVLDSATPINANGNLFAVAEAEIQ